MAGYLGMVGFDYNRSLPEYHLDFDFVATTFYLGSTTTTEQVTEQVQVLIQLSVIGYQFV